ncbi:MAG: hypothetical protein V3U24_03000 [Candidatus Neomarinimicrobiota bacterium]
MRAYLSGAIEYAHDHGEAWRNEMTDWLKKHLGHDVFNPALHGSELTEEERANFRKWKVDDYGRFMTTVRKIIDRDLKAIVDEVDYVICYWNEEVIRGAGTQGELTVAYHLGKRVYMVREMPRGEVSSWILGCCTKDFENFDQLKGCLEEKYGG